MSGLMILSLAVMGVSGWFFIIVGLIGVIFNSTRFKTFAKKSFAVCVISIVVLIASAISGKM